MPSPTEVINHALDLNNVSPIDSIDGEDAKSQKCRRIYEMALPEVFEEDEWNAAKTRVAVAADVETPLSEWTYQYTLPADCGRIVRINDDDTIEWEEEGRKILTDEASPIYLEYIKTTVTDPNQWSASFRRAFHTYLKARYAEAFPQDGDKAANSITEYEHALQKASAKDGQSGPVHTPEVSTLTTGIRRY